MGFFTNFGNRNECGGCMGGGNYLWIILLLLCCGGCDGIDPCLIILLLLLCGCGNNEKIGNCCR